MFTLGGVFIDKFGTKLGLALSLAIWTVASGLHSIATTVSAFVIFRFMLGIGEGACFPGVIKGVMEWIPDSEKISGYGYCYWRFCYWSCHCSFDGYLFA